MFAGRNVGRRVRQLVGMAVTPLLAVAVATAPASAGELDSTPPVLTSASIGPLDVTAGGELTVAYQATDDTAVTSVTVWVQIPGYGRARPLTDDTPTDGLLTYRAPSSFPSGDWQIYSIVLDDAAGNRAIYYAAGRLITNPPSPVDTHTVKMSGYASVTGTSVDGRAPLLSGVKVSLAPYTDEWDHITGTIAEANIPVRIEVVEEYDQIGAFYTYGSTTTQALDFEAKPMGAGPRRLVSIKLTDARGNSSTYRRDGSSSGTGHLGTHPFNFPGADQVIRPGRPYGWARSKPSAIEMQWYAWENESKTYSGYRVTVSPGGKTFTVPVGRVSNGAAVQKLVVPATNGTTYRVTIVPLSRWGDGKALTADVTPLPSTNVFAPGDVSGDGKVDVVAMQASGVPIPNANMGVNRPVFRYAGTGKATLAPRVVMDSTHPYTRVAPLTRTACDYGRAGFIALNDRTLEAHCAGSYYQLTSASWAAMRFLDVGGDFSGDRIDDLLAVTPAGALLRYQRGPTGIHGSKQIGSGWGSFTAVFSPGDFSGDKLADVVAVDTAGRMWLYKGNGRGGWIGSRTLIGQGWGVFGAVFALRDINGDGRSDIGAITMGGDFYAYLGNGRGGFSKTRPKIGSGWQVYF